MTSFYYRKENQRNVTTLERYVSCGKIYFFESGGIVWDYETLKKKNHEIIVFVDQKQITYNEYLREEKLKRIVNVK